jgi:hypothetical protein
MDHTDAAKLRPAFIFTTKVEGRTCPACQCVLDGSTGVSLDQKDTHPVLGLGDITCCAYCGTILVCTTLGFRMATDADLEKLDPDLRKLTYEFSFTHSRHGRLA